MRPISPSELSDSQLSDILSFGSAALERYDLELQHEDTGPGKFEGNENPGLAEAIYNRSLEGWNEDETGSVEWDRHVSLLGRFVLFADDQGFVVISEHNSTADARDAFAWWEREYDQDCPDEDA